MNGWVSFWAITFFMFAVAIIFEAHGAWTQDHPSHWSTKPTRVALILVCLGVAGVLLLSGVVGASSS